MLVQQILKAKSGDDDVVTIAPDKTLGDAAGLLSERKIGAVVVSPDGKAVSGIVSERDIVRLLGEKGAACLGYGIADVMTEKIITCARNETSDEVLAKMTQGRFRHMPVMDGDEMIGLISIGDVVKAQLSELAMEKQALEGMIKGF